MVSAAVARALAQRSAQGLGLNLAPEKECYETKDGTAFFAEAKSDLDSGWIVVHDDGSREFVSVPPDPANES